MNHGARWVAIYPREIKSVLQNLEAMQSAIKEHSCGYKIGHPQITTPCQLCLLEKEFAAPSEH
jgi:hypothetical protein